jgi:outer membrane receptor protein involved in Fe transport
MTVDLLMNETQKNACLLKVLSTLTTNMNTDTPKKIRQALGSVLFALLVIGPLNAQQAPSNADTKKDDTSEKKKDEDLVHLSPFVVSQNRQGGYEEQQTLAGSRSAKNLLDIPTSVNIVNRELIDDLGATTTSQAINFGVSGVSQGSDYYDATTARGFGSAQSLRDGVTKFTFKTVPMYDVERLEIIKGPAGMLLGNNQNFGSSTNLITRGASSTPTGDAQLTVGSKNYIRLAANVAGPAIKSDDFSLNYRLTVGSTNADRDKEMETVKDKFVGGALDMRFGRTSSLQISGYVFQNDGYRYWDDFIDLSTALAYPGAAGGKGALKWGVLNPNSSRSFSPGRRKDTGWKNNDSFISATFLSQLTENGHLRIFAAISNLHDIRRIMRGISLAADNYTLNRQFFPKFLFDQVDNNIQIDYLHHLDLKGVKFDTTFGCDGFRTDYRQAYTVLTAPALDTRKTGYPDEDAWFAANPTALLTNGPNTSADGVQHPVLFSYYGQENLSFWKDRIILIGGLRWYLPGGTNTNMLTNVTTNRPDKTLKVHKYGMVIKVLPTVSVYYGDGQNARQQVGFADLTHGGDQLDPLKDNLSIEKEYGVKFANKLSDKLSFYGSVAHYDMSNTNVRINFQFPDGSFGQIQNAKDSAHGWEVDFGMKNQFEHGRNDLVFTYDDGKSTTAADPTLITNGFVPSKTSFVEKYTWTDGALKGLMLGGAVMAQAVSRQGSFAIDNPTIIDLFGRYQFNSHWDAQVNVHNLTNKRYITSIITNGLIEANNPLQVTVMTKYKW